MSEHPILFQPSQHHTDRFDSYLPLAFGGDFLSDNHGDSLDQRAKKQIRVGITINGKFDYRRRRANEVGFFRRRPFDIADKSVQRGEPVAWHAAEYSPVAGRMRGPVKHPAADGIQTEISAAPIMPDRRYIGAQTGTV
jgi:hypothetical protein